MASTKRIPIRFTLLTAIVWLAVAAGIIFLLWKVITRISGRDLLENTPTPDLTMAYQTLEVMQTTQQTSMFTTALPTITPPPTVRLTQIPSTLLPSPLTTYIPAGITQTSQPQVLCDRAAAGNPIDVTIPDNSIISSGQSFTKTWKLVNIGSCTWTPSYSARFFYGDRMEAPEAVALQENVLPSLSVEISIEMVAPSSAGTYQGNWKLSNPSGVMFGIGPNGDSPFWVRIIVPENPSNTATVAPSLTATPAVTQSPSPTPPPVHESGELSPAPGDSIDLDTLVLNAGDADLVYQLETNNYHWLVPNDGATLGIYASLEPNLADCQSASMSSAPIAVESLSEGTYICYTSNEGRIGRALLKAVNPDDFTLTLNMLTWELP
jgi:hypothetical protein